MLRRLLAGPDSFELFIDDITNLDKIAKTQPFRRRGRHVQRQLLDGRVRSRVALIEPLLTRQVIGRCCDRNIAGGLVPVGLLLGRREDFEELGNALVFVAVMTVQHPQGGTANDGILRRRCYVGVERQHRLAEFKILDTKHLELLLKFIW